MNTLLKVLNQIPYSNGAKEVFQTLRSKHVKTAIVSAGLSILADKAARELGADLAVSNELEIQEGVFTGGIEVKVSVTGQSKNCQRYCHAICSPNSRDCSRR